MTESIVPPLLSAEKQIEFLLVAPEHDALTVRIIPQEKRLGNNFV